MDVEEVEDITVLAGGCCPGKMGLGVLVTQSAVTRPLNEAAVEARCRAFLALAEGRSWWI
jgi:hypothetical protein